MPFDEYGFLGKQVEEFSKALHNKYNELFDLVYEINQFAHNIKFNYEMKSSNAQHVIAAGLFIRVLNSFQSSIILSERGLVVDAGVVLRSNIQTVAYLKLISDSPEFVQEYANLQKVVQLRLMNAILNDQDKVFTNELKDAVTEEQRDKLKIEVDTLNVKQLKVEDIARRAGLQSLYQTAYRILSNEEHTAPQTLNRYYKLDDEGDLESLECIPQAEGMIPLLLTSASIVLIALDATSRLFETEIENEIVNFEKRLLSMKP